MVVETGLDPSYFRAIQSYFNLPRPVNFILLSQDPLAATLIVASRRSRRARRQPMSGDRSRGRPGRQVTELAGREKLLHAARAIMREKLPVRLHRKQIASAAGLAPALVTYYFRDEESLIEAAARPIINDYVAALGAILDDLSDPRTALRRLITLLLSVSRDNGQLLDTYVNYLKQNNVPHKGEILMGSYAQISRLFTHFESIGLSKRSNTAFMATALWGICKTIAQLPELVSILQQGSDQGDRDIMNLQTDLVFEFIMNAIGREEQ